MLLYGFPSRVCHATARELFIYVANTNKERKGKQVSQVFEQHGYITMQLTRQFSSLADTYGILKNKISRGRFERRCVKSSYIDRTVTRSGKITR